MTKNTDNKIKSVDTSFDIVETLLQTEAMTITELADSLERSPSNVLEHLRTLQDRGFVIKEDGKFRPGLKYYEIGNKVKRNHPLYTHGTGPADDLANEINEYVWLMAEEQRQGYYIYKTGGEDAVESGAYPIGSRWPLNSTASGKVILAHMDNTRLENVLATHELNQWTSNTITDQGELIEELEEIREKGFAIDNEESAIGIQGIAVPVCGIDGIIGTISISGPASRITGEYLRTTLSNKLIETADIIRIHYNGESAVDN